jgi:signal transduction histidine kinase/ActR/RegA family two-component response regulator
VGNVSSPHDDSSRDVEDERRSHVRAVADADKQRRLALALDRFASAVVADSAVDDLLQRLLEIFVDVAAVDVGVLRLRDADRLVSKAAIGVEEEVVAGFSIALEDALPRQSSPDGVAFAPVQSTEPCGGAHIQQKGVRELYCIPLSNGDDLVAVAYLGVRTPRAMANDAQQLLRGLSSRASAAIARRIEIERLREGVRSRDAILGVVAHDLRNPINVIALAANSLLQRMPESSARKPLDRILRGAHRADRLIQDLLEINTIEAGRFSIETRIVETADTILAALESQQSLAANASIIMASDISPELPSIEADEERLLEVLENLVGNAIKFTPAGGTVTVGASARKREVLFWVKDSGCGIPQDQLPHLFDRFWQASKMDRRGTGLGLTICKAIVEAHGGRIWPETKVGEGTTMFFTIPAGSDSPRAQAVEVADILLVDDRPENLLSLKAILDRPDYRLVTATSGEEALRIVLREQFSVALIDIAMPRMSGLEVAMHLKELDRTRHIPIIFITAFGDDPQEIHRAYSAGGADYLVKPLDSEIVRKKVAVFVDLSRRRHSSGLSEDLNTDAQE